MDKLAQAYKTIRDATMCNEDLTTAERIAVLELVKHEIIADAQHRIEQELKSA